MSEETAAPTAETTTPVTIESQEAAAVEQAAEAQSTRDELIAAANAAPKDGEDPQADDAPKAEKPAKKAQPEAKAAPSDDGITHVAKILRERKEKERARLAEREAKAQATAKLEAERASFQAEQSKLRAELEKIEAERARLREIQKDPMKVAEFAGMTPEQLAQNLAMHGSPEFQEAQRIRAELQQQKELIEQLKRYTEEQRTEAEKAKEAQQVAAQQQNERAFVEHTASDEKYPYLSALTPKVRLNWGYEVAEEYYKATNKVASDQEIAEYIEGVLTEQYAKRTSQPSAKVGKAPVSRANGPRALSSAVASERRATAKPTNNDLRGEDLRKELLAAARNALTQT